VWLAPNPLAPETVQTTLLWCGRPTRTTGIKAAVVLYGDFARSLATRLVYSGFQVVVGSRNPKRCAGLFPSAAEVTAQADAANKTDVIFVAVFREHYSTLCDLTDVLAGKILVDVSNNTEINHHKESNAEYLASLFPACTVVKGFNVISAWTLQTGPRDGNKQVLICCDNQEAKRTVAEIAQVMGFTPVDMGSLSSACEIENIPLRLLPAWKIPVFLALGLFLCFYTYNFIRQVLHPYIWEQKNKFYKIPVEVINSTLPCVAYVMLSRLSTRGPGRLLPAALWHKVQTLSRLARPVAAAQKADWPSEFFCAALHAVYSLCLPMRRSHRYQLINAAVKQSHANLEEEVWRMEIYVSFGIMALGLLSLLAITSLPSIANSLNWREFSFIQVNQHPTHLTFGWTRAFDENQYKFYLPPSYTLTLLVPCTVILYKSQHKLLNSCHYSRNIQ
uniref:STEAP3 metalloreductase n=1 Tax=Gopherus evgoodei TaxID=1825980 RepID=A0A8C4YSJ5_9SAUR